MTGDTVLHRPLKHTAERLDSEPADGLHEALDRGVTPRGNTVKWLAPGMPQDI